MKDRRINELERKLRHRDEELERLKIERDRLVSISNDLRGELNISQRRLLEEAEESLGREEQEATIKTVREQIKRHRDQI